MTRLDRLRATVKSYGSSPDDFDEDVEEDIRPYYSGEKYPEKFLLVTANGDKPFFLTLETLADAFFRGVEYASNDIFIETPLEVVDLDTGTSWVPKWSSLQWRKLT